MDQLKKRLKIKNILVRQCLSECLGTFILIIFGLSASAQVRTTQGMKGQYLSINMAFSVGVMVAMYISRNISGAHLNPALSLCSCVMGQMPWAKLLPYCLSQVLGAYIASAVVFFMYYDAIMDYSSGILTVYGANETASIFATYPSEFLTLGSSFLDQAVGTGMIMMCYLPLVDIQNDPVPHNLVPPLVAVGLLGISMAMSSNCGGAINPARDLGPRLLTLCAGWGTEVFTAYNYWFWVPIVAPMVGAVLATWIYVIIIQWHLPEMYLPQLEPEEPRSDLLPGTGSHRSVETAFENGLELSQKL